MCLLWGTMRTVQQGAIESTTHSPVWKFLPQIWQLEQGLNHLLDLCHSSILNCWLFTKILLRWKKKETIRKRKTIRNSQQNYIGIFESVKTGCAFLCFCFLTITQLLTQAKILSFRSCTPIVLFLFPGYFQRGEGERKNWGHWTWWCDLEARTLLWRTLAKMGD